jgi:hypothetical protein
MADLTPRARRILLALGGVYAVVNTFIGVHSGGDFVFHLRLAERLLQGQPLYLDFDGSIGLPWPPFAIVALAPFALLARLSLPLTKAVWAVGNVALFGWCLVRGFRHAGRWTPVVLAVVAVAQPLQSNFQHLNINLVLLALVVLAIADLEQAREMRAALWIGVATALKGYPGAIFLYFLARGRWRPLVAGVAAAVGLTFLIVVLAGAANVSDYVHLALTAQSTQALAGQSIGGLVARLGGNVATAVILDLLAVAGVAVVLWRGRASGEPTYEVGMTALLAVLLAPLDRLHYYVLAFPAWTDTFSRPAPPRGRAVWFTALAVGGLLTSGMLSHFRGPLPAVLWIVRQNTYNFGALILLIVLVARRVALPQPLPVSPPT